MLRVFVTGAIVSKGFDGAPAIKIHQGEKSDIVRFRIGTKVFDPKAEGNNRWFNLSVKAFGNVCERIKKMELKEGSYINLSGRLDEESWEDPTTHQMKKMVVLIADEVEYCYAGNNSENRQSSNSEKPASVSSSAQPTNAAPAEGFTGYEAFAGGTNSFFG